MRRRTPVRLVSLGSSLGASVPDRIASSSSAISTSSSPHTIANVRPRRGPAALLEPGARRGLARRVAASGRTRRPGPSREGDFDMSNLWRDLRLGVRTALGSPGYSAIAVLTMALAIGANTLLFSIANPLVIRGLPLKDPDTLGWIFGRQPSNGRRCAAARLAAGFSGVARRARRVSRAWPARDTRGATLTGHGDAEAVKLLCATTNLQRHVGPARPSSAGSSSPARTRPAAHWSACSATATGATGSTATRQSSTRRSCSTTAR